MKYVELRRVNTDETFVDLPNYTSLTFDAIWNPSPSVINIEYPFNEAVAAGIKEGAFIAILPDGVEIPDRYVLETRDAVTVTDSGFVGKWAGRSLKALLEDDFVWPSAWPNPTPQGHAFVDSTAGTIMKTFLTRSNDRGFITALQHGSFSGTTDSTGTAWPSVVDRNYSNGQSLLQVAQGLYDAGMIELRTNKFALQMYRPGGLSRHLSIDTVCFTAGLNIADESAQRDATNFYTDVLMEGENTAKTATDTTVYNTIGRRRARYASAGGVGDAGTVQLLANTDLAMWTHIAQERSLGVTHQTGTPQPFVDYRPGDWVWLDLGAGTTPTEIQVQQISVRVSSGQQIQVALTLGDLLDSADEALKRRLDAITGANAGGSGPIPGSTGTLDLAPAAPTGLGTTYGVYVDDKGVNRVAVTLTWNQVTTNADGTTADDISVYDVYMRDDSSSAAWMHIGRTSALAAFYSPLPENTWKRYKVVTEDTAGKRSADSAELRTLTPTDTTGPVKPSTPLLATKLATITITWDGVNVSNGPMDADFAYCEVHASTTSGFTLSAGTYKDRLWGRGNVVLTNLTVGQTWYVRLRPVDKSGNFGTVSDQVSIVVEGVVDADLSTSLNNDIDTALANANAALAAAGGASTTFAQPSIPTSTAVGDLWIDTDDGNRLYRAVSVGANEISPSEWVLVGGAGREVFYQPSIPVSKNIGDLWFDSDANNRLYRAASVGADQVTAGEWVEVTDIRINNWTYTGTTNINGGMIQTDTIEATAIKAHIIGVDKLLVGGVMNQVPNGTGEYGTLGGIFPSGTTGINFEASDKPAELRGVFKTNAGTSTLLPDQSLVWSCEGSTEWLVEIWLKANVSGSRITVELRDQNNAHATTNAASSDSNTNFGGSGNYPISNLTVPTVWTKYTSIATTNPGTTLMRVGSVFFNQSTGSTTSAIQSFAIRVRPRNAGLLVVDGSIVSNKIASGAITTNKLDAGVVTAEKVALGVLRTNPIANPGFEDDTPRTDWTDPGQGNVNNWRQRVSGANASVARVLGKAHSGSWRLNLRITGTGSASDFAEIYTNAFLVKEDTSYHVTWGATAYGAGTSSQTFANLRVDALFGSSASTVAQSGTTISLGDGGFIPVPYTSFDNTTADSYDAQAGDFTVPAGQTELWCVLRFTNMNNPADSVIIVDDFACIEAGVGGASELTAAGLRLFNDLGAEVVALVTNRPNYFNVTAADGSNAGVSNLAALYGKDLIVSGDPVIGGDPLIGGYVATKNDIVDYQPPTGRDFEAQPIGLLEAKADGMVAKYRATPSTFSGTTLQHNDRLHMFTLAADLLPGRSYKINTSQILMNVSAVSTTLANASNLIVGMYVRFTTDGSDPTTSSPILFYDYAFRSSTGFISLPASRHDYDNLSSGIVDLRLAFWLYAYNCTMNVNNGAGNIQCEVIDQGPVATQTGTTVNYFLDASTTTPTPPPSTTKTYVTTWNCNDWATYRSKNTILRGQESSPGDTGGHVYQGQSSSTSFNGNQRGLWTFPTTIQGIIASASVTKIEVKINWDWWYYNSGGYTRLTVHGYSETTIPSGLPSMTFCKEQKFGAKSGDQWITLPSSFYNGFKTGAYKGVGIGPGPTSSVNYYGYAQANATQIRITYVK